MDTVTRKPDVSKLLTMTDNVVLRNRVYRDARASGNEQEEKSQFGRLNQSINQLQETAEHFRKAGQP
jgi:hypothetical protein